MVTEKEVELIGRILVDSGQSLTSRFRALFTLRNLGGPVAIKWISQAFEDDSALLKHELAYCLGQMQDERAIPILVSVLQDTHQEPMVRHEAGDRIEKYTDGPFLKWVIKNVGSVSVHLNLLNFPFQAHHFKKWFHN